METYVLPFSLWDINTLRPRQNGRLFTDDTFKRIFLNENIRISTKNSLKFVPKDLINNIPALVLIMAWRRPGDKPLSEPMLVRSLTHICVTRPQWVKSMTRLVNGYSFHRLRWAHAFLQLTHYGLVTPFDDINLGQHWVNDCCLTVPSHYLNQCWQWGPVAIIWRQFYKRYPGHQLLKLVLSDVM